MLWQAALGRVQLLSLFPPRVFLACSPRFCGFLLLKLSPLCLYTIAVDRLRDHNRRARVECAALDRVMMTATPSVDPPDDVIADRQIQRVMRALEVLTERDREIIARRFGAELTSPQIVTVTGQPRTTVDGRLFRALRRLRKVLEPQKTIRATAASVSPIACDRTRRASLVAIDTRRRRSSSRG